ncbi:MAG: HemK family protein methyltransferase, partial [Xanthomonadales bacterium]|nr:HemK family protein methyltransferase [Xanthomonadales bacterium]
MTKEQLFIHLVEELSSSDLFFGHSAIDAEDEAMMILMHLFDESTNEVLNSGSSEVSEAAINQAEQICYQRISERKPLAYIIKKAWFCGVEFKVDERALVPRSPIAELIQNQFKPWFSKENQSCTALDLCTGSGCIGISMSIFMENMKVDISDISREALQLAAENIKNH